MNFSQDSVKPKTKHHNEDFYFDVETPRGHFFAVLDFASHDYANLNATLKGKLETIVGSFASLDDFSDELFLGFLAKEINNFVSNLADQSGGPELLFSAALCLLSGDHLSWLSSGNITISIVSSEDLLPLQSSLPAPRLGASSLETPVREGIGSRTLQDDDLVLIGTEGLTEAMRATTTSLRGLDPRATCDSLMNASAASDEDRTVLVIGGPYDRPADETLAEVTTVDDLKASLASMAARLDALTRDEARKPSDAVRLESNDAIGPLVNKLTEQIESLKTDLSGKAASLDLLEIGEKISALSASLSGKADTADVLELQRDVLKLGLTSTSIDSDNTVASRVSPAQAAASGETGLAINRNLSWFGSLTPRVAIVIAAISLIGGFIGGWLNSRAMNSPEIWAVKSSGNQIVISRLDGPTREDATISVAAPLNSTGEQTFSSFADVRQYLDTITKTVSPSQTSPENQASPSTSQGPQATSEITIRQGDTLKRLAQVYKVPPEKLMELNPNISRWPAIKVGQKVLVPATAPTSASSSTPEPVQSPANQNQASTTEVRVGPGDSLNELARRFNTSTERIKELNPNVTNWLRIRSGQKVIVPAPVGG